MPRLLLKLGKAAEAVVSQLSELWVCCKQFLEQSSKFLSRPIQSSTPKSLITIDEGALLFTPFEYRDEILAVDGVPPYEYLVEGELPGAALRERCFVFEALLKVVGESALPRETELSEEIKLALPQAWVTLEEAIAEYGIVPRPFKKVEVNGELAILHQPFNALLPPRFRTEGDRNLTLAKLMSGERLLGGGDFQFRGQGMQQLQSIKVSDLPPAPEFGLNSTEIDVSTWLKGVKHVPSEYLSQEQFEEIMQAEEIWSKTKRALNRFVNPRQLWCVADQWLRELSIEEGTVPDYAQGLAVELAPLYPELGFLGVDNIYWYFDCYKYEWDLVRGYEAERSDEFLLYLLNECSRLESEDRDEQALVGTVMAWSLHKSKTKAEAISLAAQALQYNRANVRLARQIYSACQYLAEISPTELTLLKGQKILAFAS